MKKINELREKINEIDDEIVEILNTRADLVKKIGAIKNKTGLSIFDRNREDAILQKIRNTKQRELTYTQLRQIYKEIFSVFRSLEREIKVAFLGPVATFTHQAAQRYFGTQPKFISLRNITDVFLEVERERADFGVVPVENSNEGAVTHTLDMLLESDLSIIAEEYLRIHLNFMISKDTKNVKRIFVHPLTIGQARRFIEQNKDKDIIEVESTARAAAMAQRDKESGAIASEVASRIFNLNLIEKNIEDNPRNFTRFFILTKGIGHHNDPTGKDKSSIAFSVKDEIGILYKMLLPFYENGINLTKIESRPDKKKLWEYIFFVDFVGHFEDENVKKTLSHLEKSCIFLKKLGTYPTGEYYD